LDYRGKERSSTEKKVLEKLNNEIEGLVADAQKGLVQGSEIL